MFIPALHTTVLFYHMAWVLHGQYLSLLMSVGCLQLLSQTLDQQAKSNTQKPRRIAAEINAAKWDPDHLYSHNS